MGMLNFAIYLLEVSSTILIAHAVFQSKVRLNFCAIFFHFVSVGMLCLAYVTKIQYITYIAQLAILLYCFLEFHKSWWATILRFGYSIAIGAILETLILMEIRPWLQASKYSLYTYLCISMVMFACSAIIYWFFACKQISFGVDMADKTFIILVFVINAFVLYVKEDGRGRYLRLIICLISFVLLITRFAMIMKKEKRKNVKEESEWLSCYTEQYESLINEVRKRQHNYRNEIATIKTVCAAGDGEVAMDVIKEFEDAEQYTGILNGCENPIIAGLIYSKMKEFKNAGVTMTCHIRIRNVGLALEIREIIDVIGILLDNAFECTNKQECNTMRLEIVENEKGVSIKTSNPSPYISSEDISKIFTFGYSTKGKNRGIGLHTVRELVKKCHGDIITCNHTVENINHFKIQVIIPFNNKCVGQD